MAPAGTSTARRKSGRQKTTITYAEDENSDSEPESRAHEVETIKDNSIEKDGTEFFLVEWKDSEEASWVPKENFEGVGDDIIKDFYKRMAKENNPIAESDSVSGSNRKRRLDDTSKRKRRRQQGKKGISHDAIAESLTPEKKLIRPSGSLEGQIESFDEVCENASGGLTISFRCRNGDKLRANSELLHEKCPKQLLKYYEKHLKIMPKNAMEELPLPSTEEKQSAPCRSCEDEIETIANLGGNTAGLLGLSITWKSGEETRSEGATFLDCVQKVVFLPLPQRNWPIGLLTLTWPRQVNLIASTMYL